MAQYIGYPDWSSIPQNTPPLAEEVNAVNNAENVSASRSNIFNRTVLVSILCFVVIVISLVVFMQQESQLETSSIHITELPDLPEARAGGTMLRDGNFIYYIGRSDAEFMRDNNWCYDISTKTWLVKTPMPTERAEAGCALLNGIIYCFGGWRGDDSGMTTAAEAYNTSTGEWNIVPSLPHAITCVSAITFNDGIYILGGTTGETKNYFFRFDPKKLSYDSLPIYESERLFAKLTLCNNRIFASGGQSFTKGQYHFHTDVDEFLPNENKWVARTPLPQPVSRSAIAFTENDIYVASGTNKIGDDTTGLVNQMFIYNNKSSSWTSEIISWKLLGSSCVGSGDHLYFAGGHSEFPNPTPRFFEITLPD